MVRLAACFLLAGCASITGDRDYAGNLYPPECTRDIVPFAIVEYVSQAEMEGIAHAFGEPEIYGLTVRIAKGGPAFVWVRADDGMSQELRRDILRHELCHALVGEWHE